jgi:hypothetical protein
MAGPQPCDPAQSGQRVPVVRVWDLPPLQCPVRGVDAETGRIHDVGRGDPGRSQSGTDSSLPILWLPPRRPDAAVTGSSLALRYSPPFALPYGWIVEGFASRGRSGQSRGFALRRPAGSTLVGVPSRAAASRSAPRTGSRQRGGSAALASAASAAWLSRSEPPGSGESQELRRERRGRPRVGRRRRESRSLHGDTGWLRRPRLPDPGSTGSGKPAHLRRVGSSHQAGVLSQAISPQVGP